MLVNFYASNEKEENRFRKSKFGMQISDEKCDIFNIIHHFTARITDAEMSQFLIRYFNPLLVLLPVQHY